MRIAGSLSAAGLRWLVAVLLALPLGWAVWASLQDVDRLFGQPATRQWCVDNYRLAVTRLPFARFLANSLFITSVATIGTVLTASMAGFALAHLRFRMRRAVCLLVLTTMILPEHALLLPRFILFRSLGWVDTYKPLIVPAWLGGGAFYVFLFQQYFRTIPRDMLDAARVDGASAWQVYRKIVLPASAPVLAAAISIAAVAHWQAFIEPLVYLSDFHDYPVSVGLRMYHAMQGAWGNYVMAASLLALLPPAAIVLLTQRHLMRSLESTPER